MYKLYTRRHTGGFAVEVALVWSGAPYERVDVQKSAQQDPAFLKVSPLGQVPVLELADGVAITESAAMCILLADHHPQAAIAPGIHLRQGDWLCGSKSIADVYLLMMQTWHPDDDLVRTTWPNIERVASALRAEPSIAALNAYYDMWR